MNCQFFKMAYIYGGDALGIAPNTASLSFCDHLEKNVLVEIRVNPQAVPWLFICTSKPLQSKVDDQSVRFSEFLCTSLIQRVLSRRP